MKPQLAVVVFLLTLVSSVAIAVSCHAEQTWGHVRGRFVWDGEIPSPRMLNVSKDFAALGRTIPNESLLVIANNRGIANIAIYLPPTKAGQTIPVHPSYADDARKEVVIAIKGNHFAPHVAVIRTSQKLILKNNDDDAHNPNIATHVNAAVNTLLNPDDAVAARVSVGNGSSLLPAQTVNSKLNTCPQDSGSFRSGMNALVSSHPLL